MWRLCWSLALALLLTQSSRSLVAGVVSSGTAEVLDELNISDDTTSNAGCPLALPYGTVEGTVNGKPSALQDYMDATSICTASLDGQVCSYALDVCCCNDCVTAHVDAHCDGGAWLLTWEDGVFLPACNALHPVWFQACLACDADIVEGSSIANVNGLGSNILSVSKKSEYTQCCQSCNANANCDAWTYETSMGTCSLYYNTEGIDILDSLATAPGIITGVMKKDAIVPNYAEPFDCFEQGTCAVVFQAFPITCSETFDEISCTVNVLIESTTAVSSFDFALKTSEGFALPIKGSNGGLVQESGLTILASEQQGTVIGYSDENQNTLPPSPDGKVLTQIELDINEANAQFFADNTIVCMSGVTASNSLNILEAGHPSCSSAPEFDTAVTVSLGDVSKNGEVDVFIASNQHLTSFQFQVLQYIDAENDPVPIPVQVASGGLAQANGFLLTVTDSGSVIGWYLGVSGGIPPSGTLVTPELLTTLHLDKSSASNVDKICIAETYFSNSAEALKVEEPPCPPVSGIISTQECTEMTTEAFNEGFEAGVETGQGDQDTYNQGFLDGQLVAGQTFEQGFQVGQNSVVSADFNSDGTINILDITLMIQYIVYENGR